MGFIYLAVVLSLFTVSCASRTKKEASVETAVKSGFSHVNGLQMYYEMHGNQPGVPLVLIHGGGSSIDVTFSKVLPYFSAKRTVIAIDEQAHGRSGDRNAPVSFAQTADDVAALLKSLNIEKADVLGFSNGATSAMQLAIRHPGIVRKLVFISSVTKRKGAPAGFWDFMNKAQFSDMPQPLKDAFLKLNPDPAKLKNMHDKDAQRMRGFKDIPDKEVRAIQAPTLIVAGDQDVVTPEHAVEVSRMIKGSRLLILPGGHGDFLGEITTAHGASEMPGLTAGLISEFLNQQ